MSTRLRLVNPEELGAPRGYSNGVLAPAGSRFLFVAGQVGWNERQELVSADFVEQFERALANVLTVVAAAGGRPENVVRFSFFVKDKDSYRGSLENVGAAYRRHMGRHFPAMSLVEVSDLLEEGALVEIEATAALPSE
ncbi:MAG TPA: RidA family protein [Thermoanaerobaculia bacterium]